MRVAVIGAGAFGQLHLSVLCTMSSVDLVGVVDTSPQRRAGVQTRWNLPTYDSTAALIRHAHPDAVIVATPEGEHEIPVVTATTYGCDVLVEKPFAVTLESVDRMIECAERHNQVLCVGHVLRFSQPHVYVKRLIDSGQIGDLVYLYARRNGARSLAAKYRRASITFIGAIHEIDLCLWYTGQPVVAVSAWGRPEPRSASPDLVSATLELADGTLVVLESGWVVPDGAPRVPDAMLEVIGTEGTAFAAADRVTSWTSHTTSESSFPAAQDRALRAELEHFVACVATRSTSEILRWEDARHAVEVAVAIDQSRSMSASRVWESR